jgi:hypothetical protein
LDEYGLSIPFEERLEARCLCLLVAELALLYASTSISNSKYVLNGKRHGILLEPRRRPHSHDGVFPLCLAGVFPLCLAGDFPLCLACTACGLALFCMAQNRP